jgi:hypothetical protein
MLRHAIILALGVAGLSCGGRDPLIGPLNPDPGLPGTSTDGPPGMVMPPAGPDARIPAPPVLSRDAAAPDAAPPVMPPVTPPPPTAMCNFPKCVLALMAPCMPSGACTSQATMIGTNICYANGVKFLPSLGLTGGRPTLIINVTTTTGARCYSVEAGVRPGGGGMTAMGEVTYRSATGATVVTGLLTGAGLLSLPCPGEPVATLPAACQPGLAAIGMGGATMCRPDPTCK